MTTKIDRAVVLAAGRGTRMRELTNDVPKPMIEVRGKPVLQHIVKGLRDAGVRDLLIIVGYHAEAVRIFFGDGPRYQCRHRICHANRAGWYGARCESCPRVSSADSPFILSYGDILISPANYKRVVDLPMMSKRSLQLRAAKTSAKAARFL